MIRMGVKDLSGRRVSRWIQYSFYLIRARYDPLFGGGGGGETRKPVRLTLTYDRSDGMDK